MSRQKDSLKIDRERANALLEYDETSSSCLRWKVARGRAHVGDVAGNIANQYKKNNVLYRQLWNVTFDGQSYLAHRVVWTILVGDIPKGKVVDHLNGNPLDNRIENIRLVDPKENSRNMRKNSSNKTGVVGVKYTDDGTGKYSYVACWRSLEGVANYRAFSCNKFGADEAFRLAVDARKKAIEALNKQGAGYTDRHQESLTGYLNIKEEECL